MKGWRTSVRDTQPSSPQFATTKNLRAACRTALTCYLLKLLRRISNGFVVPTIATDKDFQQSVTNFHERFAIAHRALGEIGVISLELQNLFKERFQIFAEPLEAAACAISLCEHHSQIQSAKSAEGKRPWFDRIGQDRIYVRHAYREKRRDIRPGRYVHDYRGRPIGRFRADLS